MKGRGIGFCGKVARFGAAAACVLAFNAGIAAAEGPAGDLPLLLRAGGGILVLENVTFPDSLPAAIDLTRHYPLGEDSWWSYRGLAVTPLGTFPFSEMIDVAGSKDMGGGVTAYGIDTDGILQWTGWESSGLLVFGEEEPDSWSSVYHRAPYLCYSSMEIGGAASGSTLYDLFAEPDHSYYGQGSHTYAHTLAAYADVTLPTGTFLDCAVFTTRGTWVEEEGIWVDRGLVVLARDVGPVAMAMFSLNTSEFPRWTFWLQYLTDHSAVTSNISKGPGTP